MVSRLIFLSVLSLLIVVGSCSKTGSCSPRPTSAGVRAAWISVYDITSSSGATGLLSTLKQEGVNRVYVDVWNQGVVYFNSTTMYNLVGPAGIGRDILSWTVAAAKPNGIEVYAWFEYGVMAAAGSVNNAFANTAQSKGWIMGSADGFIWMDPSNSGVQQFVADIMADAVALQSSVGVQLDDHFAWPVSLGGSVSAMTSAAENVRSKFRSRSDACLSLAPATLSYALSQYQVDWKTWANKGLFSEYAPQLYTTSYSTFSSELQTTMNGLPSSVWPYLLAGIRCNGSGADTTWSNLSNMISLTESKNLGVSIWYCKCFTSSYPSQFKSIWM